MLPGRSYLMRIGTRFVPARVTTLKHKVDVNTLEHMAAKTLGLNEIGLCNLSTAAPVAFDPYSGNRETGAFILIDRFTNATAGAGMITFGLRRATNIHRQSLLGRQVAGRARTATGRGHPVVHRACRAPASPRSPTSSSTKLHGGGRAHLSARRRQCAPWAEPRSRFHRCRSRREHPPRRRGRQAVRPMRA